MTVSVQPPSIPDTHAPVRWWVPLTGAERKSASAAAFGILAVFAVAAFLTPDDRGIGTHQQLGLPPCAAESLFGIPCPFCGMTTSFSHMAHGEMTEAVVVQPAGALGFVVSAVLALSLLVAVATGRAPVVWKMHRHSAWLYALGAVVIGAAWIYKILAHTGVIQT